MTSSKGLPEVPDRPIKALPTWADTKAMTTIRTNCPRCGEVDMGPEAILLSVVGGGAEGTYRFVCPVCLSPVEKRADRKIVALLVSAGVDVADHSAAVGSTVTQPELDYSGGAPAVEAEEPPPFTIDDVIRFHFLLEDDRFLRQLLEG